MKYCHFLLIPTILLVLLQCSGSNGEITNIKLSALKPDLEILRAYWLQNPQEHDREGRIIFVSSNQQILVNFENFTNPFPDDAWATDFLRLQNIFELQSSIENTVVDELFYKHNTFYIRTNPYALPETLNDNGDHWITMLPVNETENNQKSSVEIRYIDLETLAADIEGEIKKIALKSGKPSVVSVKSGGENEFVFDYVKGRKQLYLRHVRFIENSSDENSLYPFFSSSKEEAFIRYITYLTQFFVGRDSYLINKESMIRSSVRNYVLRNVTAE